VSAHGRHLRWLWARRLLWWVTALAVGLGSAWAVLRGASKHGVPAGPWRASTLAGSTEADLYTRARVALGGLLALHREETMYYVAVTDSAGRPLKSGCNYRVAGQPPKTRWWSVTAYADDLFLFPVAERRYSINSQTATLDAQGRFELVTGASAPANAAAYWIPTPGQRGLVFTLRLYNPDPALAAAPATLTPPAIERLGDCQ